eukprot:1455257-Amphidinium_carterae.1
MYFSGSAGKNPPGHKGQTPGSPRRSRCNWLRPCCPRPAPAQPVHRSNPVLRRPIAARLSGTQQRRRGFLPAVFAPRQHAQGQGAP